MTKLLHVVSSPREADSQSNGLADAYLQSMRHKKPDVLIDRLDLWSENLPEFDGDKAAAKMTFFGVGEMSDRRQSAWDQVVQIAKRFIEADHYVFAVPMWNGGVPYKLKQYIDIITQPGLLFGFEPERGYIGLLQDKTASLFYTSGVYAPGADEKYGSDFQSNYLAWWLKLIGVQKIETVRFQPSLATADPASEYEKALTQARALAS